jgi:hypothetical protein
MMCKVLTTFAVGGKIAYKIKGNKYFGFQKFKEKKFKNFVITERLDTG